MSREPFETMPDVMDAKQLAKVINQPIGQCEMYSASFGTFPSKNRITFPIQELGKIYENQEVL